MKIIKNKRTIINKISLSALVAIAKKKATTEDLDFIDLLQNDIEVYTSELEFQYENLEFANSGDSNLTLKEEEVSDGWTQATSYWELSWLNKIINSIFENKNTRAFIKTVLSEQMFLEHKLTAKQTIIRDEIVELEQKSVKEVMPAIIADIGKGFLSFDNIKITIVSMIQWQEDKDQTLIQLNQDFINIINSLYTSPIKK